MEDKTDDIKMSDQELEAPATETLQEKSRKQRMKDMRQAKAREIQKERVEETLRRERKLRPEAAGDLTEEVPAEVPMTEEQQRALVAQRLKELEAKAAIEGAVPGKTAEELLNEAAVADFDDIHAVFKEQRWGMRARLSGGPVVITAVAQDSEGNRNGIQVGDVIYEINGINVEADREPAVELIRKGGEASVHVKRLKGHAPIVTGIQGGAQNTVKGDAMSHADNIKLQAMLGQAKSKDTVTYSQQKGITEIIADDAFPASATVVFGNCQDCTYTLNAMCTKMFVQGCTNVTFIINAKVVTAIVEVYKSTQVTVDFQTKCGTLQIDMCKDVKVNFAEERLFFEEVQLPTPKEAAQAAALTDDHCNTAMIVWAGCHNLHVSVKDTKKSFTTSYEDLKKEFQDLVEERSQFRLKLVRNTAGEVKFVQERITRLDNGFFSTQAETNAFDVKQDANLKAMAKAIGVTIAPAKAKGPKCKPNEQCPMGSGKKYKKCCNRPDGVCTGKPGDW